MPIYEYKCTKCGHKFEKLVFGKEKLKCPKCGSNVLEKLFSVFSTGKKSGTLGSCKGGVCNLDCPSCET
jgi:putative FmdB family regulatory protein